MRVLVLFGNGELRKKEKIVCIAAKLGHDILLPNRQNQIMICSSQIVNINVSMD